MLKELFNLLVEDAPELEQSLSSVYGLAAAPVGGINATGVSTPNPPVRGRQPF